MNAISPDGFGSNLIRSQGHNQTNSDRIYGFPDMRLHPDPLRRADGKRQPE
jgi:hypothetical protein